MRAKHLQPVVLLEEVEDDRVLHGVERGLGALLQLDQLVLLRLRHAERAEVDLVRRRLLDEDVGARDVVRRRRHRHRRNQRGGEELGEVGALERRGQLEPHAPAALARAAEQAERGGGRLGLGEQLVRQLALVEEPVGLAHAGGAARAGARELFGLGGDERVGPLDREQRAPLRLLLARRELCEDRGGGGGQRGAEGVEGGDRFGEPLGRRLRRPRRRAPLERRRAHRQRSDGGGRLMRATQSSLAEVVSVPKNY